MELKLNKPICFFDLETTGINVSKDRIVEISILKVFPNGNKESFTWRVNPEMKIPAVTTAIHGISDDMVANEPTFNELAPKVHELIKDSDLGGFNSNRFDIPLLAEELLRAEIDFDLKQNVAVDVQTIFHKMEKRTLAAAYKFYCDKDLTNAHSAEADTLATYEVLLAQLDKYNDLENDISFLSKFGFTAAPIVLGLILGPIAETNFSQAKIIADTQNGIFSYLTSGLLNLTIISLCIISITYGFITEMKKKKND